MGRIEDEELKTTANYPIIARNELERYDDVGAGAYGSVHSGRWKTKGKVMMVAMKQVHALKREADILARIRHPNIIQFFGVSEGDLGFIIVTELAEGGSLYSYLHNPENPKIDFKQTITWALEIARGVRYLHYEAPVTIIHRDLKSGNIVLSGEGVCKLCDFGLSKILTHSCTPSSFVGTVPWMSPELITQENKISKAIDVWSYAVVLWEIISREVPYSGLGPFRIMELVTQKGSTLAIPASCPASFERLLRKCWRMNPEERCNMHQIIDALKDMQSSFMVF